MHNFYPSTDFQILFDSIFFLFWFYTCLLTTLGTPFVSANWLKSRMFSNTLNITNFFHYFKAMQLMYESLTLCSIGIHGNLPTFLWNIYHICTWVEKGIHCMQIMFRNICQLHFFSSKLLASWSVNKRRASLNSKKRKTIINLQFWTAYCCLKSCKYQI